MKLNSKVTGALAWAGLAIVIGVPAAGMFIEKPTAKTNLTSDMDQVRTTSVKPVVQPGLTAPATSEPVKEFVRSGKKLPAYISDVPVVEEATIKPAPVKKPGTITVNPDGTIDRDTPATEVASVPVQPDLVAPKPYPASLRPKAPVVAPVTAEAPLIINENQVAARDPEIILPPADIEGPLVNGDELEEWDTGSLAEYLERKGLMSETESSIQYLGPATDEDRFYLEGPASSNRSRVRRFDDDELLF